MFRTIITVICIAISVNILAAQQLVEGILAVVGKEIILKTEIDQFLQSYMLQNKIDPQKNPELVKQLGAQTLDRLINQKLMLVKAEEDTITVEDEMVDKQVDQRIRYMVDQVGSEDKLEAMFGNTMKKIRKDTRQLIKEQMLVEKVRSTMFQNVKVSRREVEEFYKTYQDSLPVKAATVEIGHILKLVQPSPDAQAEAYQKAESILNEIKNGADFSEMAQKYSDDVASAKRGGDLGMMSRGDFVPEFETAAFQLEDGQISDIVQTQFGYHIIRMVERRGEKVHTQHILIQMMPTDEDEQRTIETLKNIKNDFQHGADFSELAVKYSDDDHVTEDKGMLGVFEIDKLALPQFKTVLDSMQPGEVSNPFKTEYGYHIVYLKDRSDARTLSLEDDWQQIEQMALNFKMEREYQKWIEEMRKTVNVEIKDISS